MYFWDRLYVFTPGLVSQLGLSPSKYAQLVEHNMTVATEVLRFLFKTNAATNEYLSALIQMNRTLHSMEVCIIPPHGRLLLRQPNSNRA